MKTRKILSLLLVAAMLCGLMLFSTSASGSYSSVTANYLTMQFGDPNATEYVSPEQDITLALDPNDSNVVIVTYSGIANYYPDTLAFYVTSGKDNIDSFSNDGGVTAQPTELVNGEYTPSSNVNTGFYILTVDTANTGTTNVTRTLTITKKNHGGTVTLQFTVPPIVAPASNTGVMAYLPAPGQFTNEGVTTGGWGEAFTSGGALKAFKNSYSATGVSLGAYGGYAVFDFGSPAKNASGAVVSGIYNDPENEFGVDFIVYGNPFGTNAEPGCIQVGVDNTSGGITWYDIAGSRHYKSDTIWDYEVTYTNPYMSDDALTPAANNLGHQGYSVSYSYNYTTIGGVTGNQVTGTGSVSYNAFHKHSWFPLYCNYFVARYTQTAALAKYGMFTFADYSPYNAGTSTAATVTFRGVKLASIVADNPTTANPWNTVPDTFLFGYADCHTTGTASASQVNPYTTGRSAGGDPIDISWAVNGSGEPVKLDAIRYVRVYTGQQQMNGMSGECSTEVTSIYRATGTGDGANNGTISLWKAYADNATPMNANAVTEVSTGYYSFKSNDTYVYINGERVTDAGSSTGHVLNITAGQYVQIISQSGTRSPFITVLKGV